MWVSGSVFTRLSCVGVFHFYSFFSTMCVCQCGRPANLPLARRLHVSLPQARHPRLGKHSPLRRIPPNLIRYIATFVRSAGDPAAAPAAAAASSSSSAAAAAASAAPAAPAAAAAPAKNGRGGKAARGGKAGKAGRGGGKAGVAADVVSAAALLSALAAGVGAGAGAAAGGGGAAASSSSADAASDVSGANPWSKPKGSAGTLWPPKGRPMC